MLFPDCLSPPGASRMWAHLRPLEASPCSSHQGWAGAGVGGDNSAPAPCTCSDFLPKDTFGTIKSLTPFFQGVVVLLHFKQAKPLGTRTAEN